MARIIKNFCRGGVHLPRSAVIVVLLAVALICLAKGAPAYAHERAYCYQDIIDGTLKDDFNGGKADGNGIQYKKYGAKFDFSKKKVKTDRADINLSERCSTSGEEGDNSPYRYWFWFEGNKLRAPSTRYFHTDGFIGTTKPISSPVLDAFEYKKAGDCAAVRRYEAKASSSTFYKSSGNSISYGGYEYGLDIYIIDIKDWFESGSFDNDSYTGYVYLQPVISLHEPGGATLDSNLTSCREWDARSRERGFSEAGIATHKDHYNEKIFIDVKVKHRINFHRIMSTDTWPVKGDSKSKKQKLHSIDELNWKSSTVFRFRDLDGIKYSYDSDGNKWGLRGIRIEGVQDDGSIKDAGHFYITTKGISDVVGSKTKTTTEYSHAGSGNDGDQKDKFANRTMKYVKKMAIDYSSNEKNKYTFTAETRDKDGGTVENGKGLTGAKTWDELVEYMSSLWIKCTKKDNEVYLIYQKIDNSSKISYNKQFYEYDDSTQDYKNVYTEKTKLGTVDTTKFSPDELTLSALTEETGKKIYNSVNGYSNSSVKYYANSVSIEYTDTNGKEQRKAVSVHSQMTAEEKKKFVITIGSNNYTVWTGKNSDTQDLVSIIRKAYKSVSVTDVDYTKEITISVKYFQPKTPCVKTAYYKYYGKDNKAHCAMLSGFDIEKAFTEFSSSAGKDVEEKYKTKLDSVKGRIEQPLDFSMEYVGSESDSRYGSASYENSVYIYEYEGYYFMVRDGATYPNGKPLPVKKVSLTLASILAYDATVAGYVGAESNSWQRDAIPTGSTRQAGLNGFTIEYNTKHQGNQVVAVYREEAPALTINIYTGDVSGDESSNPPTDCTMDKNSVNWNLSYTWEETVDTSKKLESDRAKNIRVYKVLKNMITSVEHAEKYGFIKEFISSDDPDGIIQSGPSVEENPKLNNDEKGDFYLATVIWPQGSKSVATLDLYYLRFVGEPDVPSPGEPEGTSTITTEFTWDDIPDGMGSEKVSDGGGGPLEETTSVNCELKAVITQDSVTTVDAINSNPELGADGEITLPNGYNDWSVDGKYHANTLKSRVDNTSYFSRGTIKRHVETTTFVCHMHRKVVYYWYTYTIYGAVRHTMTTTQRENYNVTVNTVWFSVNNVGVWEPSNADVWNYAFPNSESGSKTEIDSDGDTRTYTANWWVSKDYYTRMLKQFESYRASGRSDSDFDWGNTSRLNSDSEKRGHFKDNTKSVYDFEWETLTLPLGSTPPSMDVKLPLVVPGIVKSDIDVLSDSLVFYHPSWEDCSDSLKISPTVLLKQDEYAFKVTTAVSVTVPTGFEYTDLMELQLSDLRIPLAEKTKKEKPLFSVDGIRIDQSKLNSSLLMEGPSNSSRVSVEYSLASPSVNPGGPQKGWFYSETANKVTLHTPVALSVEISEWAKDRVQSTRLYDHEALVLGTPFKMRLHYNGDFETPGYGSGIDTEPFVLEDDTAYFEFPFPVFTKDTNGVVKYHEMNEMFKIKEVSRTTFYAAYWSEEDVYNYVTQIEALNVIGQDAMEDINNRQERITSNTNDTRDYYRVEFVKTIDVVGILTDLRITDVGDYPLLQGLFRVGDSYHRTSFAIHTGWKNFVGQTFDKTVASIYPVINGQKLSYQAYNTFKTGYKIRFNITTIASMFTKEDTVDIKPTFYWVPKSLVLPATPQKVVVYYDENTVLLVVSQKAEPGVVYDSSLWQVY